jgi:polyhydroxyalkanoate synthesis regulator phasin
MSDFTFQINNNEASTEQLDRIIIILDEIRNTTMATQEAVDALTAQVAKIQTEVTGAVEALKVQIAALQAIIDAGQPVIDLSGLQAAVQVLDELNPDAPV